METPISSSQPQSQPQPHHPVTGTGGGAVAASSILPTTTQVSTVITSLENLIEADSSAILGDLDLLTKLNNAAVDRYRSMTDAAKGLENDSEYLRQRYAELKKYTRQVDDIDQRVGDLEKLVKELDEWCSELEVKVKRIGSAKRWRSNRTFQSLYKYFLHYRIVHFFTAYIPKIAFTDGI